ncbi:hypothetical protein [Falsiroseomonas tokyonensis]|uniref:DUF2306 domain-containing protein n=1 Tax=Falsiroseomonas tokyonensis TaxID=430521 RepID=A0ABV7BR86_9PROT|nr:hypothetical protein [Falsiroseomonas tokyonensis]MBU8537333.1 hypothetical protein [Falsiroseomonas tokyonensis]
MILGLSFTTFVTLHVVLSLIGIVAGLVALGAMLAGNWTGRWSALFLGTTAATVVTGFIFPIGAILPSHVVGAISVVTLAVAFYALYARRLAGRWRATYVVAAAASLYLNCFVGVAQAFLKLGRLQALAPTQSEPPFLLAQIALLATFVVAGGLALRRFHPVMGGRLA